MTPPRPPRASVVGSSSGGYLAQQLAVVHREKVAALVLLGCPVSLPGLHAFADEVDALADPVDEDWVRRSLSWFPCCSKFRHGISRTVSATVSNCQRMHGKAF